MAIQNSATVLTTPFEERMTQEDGVLVIFAATINILAFANGGLVISYLRSKPLGSQTLLDKGYIHFFAMAMIFGITKTFIDASDQLGILISDIPALVISWIRFFFLEMTAFSFLTVTMLNIILVIRPLLVDEFSDESVTCVLQAVVIFLSLLSSIVAYFIGVIPMNYLQLTQRDKQLWNGTSPIRLCTLTTTLAINIVFRIYIACKKKTFAEGEGNLLSNSTMLIIGASNVIHQIVVGSLMNNALIFQAVQNYAVSVVIVTNQRQLRRYVFRHSTRFLSSCFLGKVVSNFALRLRLWYKKRTSTRVDAVFELPNV